MSKPIASDETDEEFSLKSSIADKVRDFQAHEAYSILADLNCDIFLTTNYDHAIHSVLGNQESMDKSETLYSIRRWRKFTGTDGKSRLLCHIHGDIEYPKTMMLGYDHYIGGVAKISDYVKGTYKFPSKTKDFKMPALAKRLDDSSEPQSHLGKLANSNGFFASWIDAFFFTNLHIIGLGLDFSESDIWWLLNRRIRLIRNKINVNNKIYYYPTDKNKERDSLLTSFGVEVCSLEDTTDFEAIYSQQLANLKDRLVDDKE